MKETGSFGSIFGTLSKCDSVASACSMNLLSVLACSMNLLSVLSEWLSSDSTVTNSTELWSVLGVGTSSPLDARGWLLSAPLEKSPDEFKESLLGSMDLLDSSCIVGVVMGDKSVSSVT